MARRDYLLDFLERSVQGAGRIVSRMILLRRRKRPRRAIREADEFLYEIGLDPVALDGLRPSSMPLLVTAGGGDVSRSMAAAAILREKAAALRLLPGGASAAKRTEARALVLCLALWRASRVKRHPFYRANIPALAHRVPRRRRRSRELLRLARFFETCDRFDEAENEWAELHRRHPAKTRAPIRRFYLRLLVLDDARLAEGGLPRSEVLEALAFFRDEARGA